MKSSHVSESFPVSVLVKLTLIRNCLSIVFSRRNVLVFNPVATGYGSPQLLYLADYLTNKDSRRICIIEPKEKLRVTIPKAGQVVFSSRLERNAVYLACILKSWLAPVELITSSISWPLAFLSPRSRSYLYLLELDNPLYSASDNQCRLRVLASLRLVLARYLISRSHSCIAPSAYRARYIESCLALSNPLKVIQNCPPISHVAKKHKSLLPGCKIRVLYQGQINDSSQALKFIELARNTLGDVDWHVAGMVDKCFLREIKRLNDHPCFHFYGLVPSQELERLRECCHVGLVTWGVGPTLAHKYSAPNKLYEYISSGLLALSFYNLQSIILAGVTEGVIVSNNCSNDVSWAQSFLQNLVSAPDMIEHLSQKNLNAAIHLLNSEQQYLSAGILPRNTADRPSSWRG